MESTIVKTLVQYPKWLQAHEESALRWALSLARVSAVCVDPNTRTKVDIGHATDAYRQELYELLKPFVDAESVTDRKGLAGQIPTIRSWAVSERRELIELYGNQMPASALDDAVRRRPLALALSGGGGASYVFVGAFMALQAAGIRPDLIAATSMGALLGLYRACELEFDIDKFKRVFSLLSWDSIVRTMPMGSRFCIPSTFQLCLSEVFRKEFQYDNRNLRLSDLPIPLRVAIAGISHIDGEPDVDWHVYERLRPKGLPRALLDLAKKPLRAIYLGRDESTSEFDALDAAGFSAAIPGVFQYDITNDNPRMQQLVADMMRKYGVVRLLDGGLVNNLPADEAKRAVQSGATWGYDPFVLALDAFAPTLSRHWMFLPLMKVAAENSKQGHEAANLVITYSHVLSPINVVPSAKELERVAASGLEETLVYITFIKKMLSIIDDLPSVC